MKGFKASIVLAISLLLVLVWLVFAAPDNIPIAIMSATNDLTIGDIDLGRVYLSVDSTEADSSYGTFSTAKYDVAKSGRAVAVLQHVKVRQVKDTTYAADTVIFHLLTSSFVDNEMYFLCTLSVDTLYDTGSVSYWLGTNDAWVGTDSLGDVIWWDCTIIDSCNSDVEARKAYSHDYYFRFAGEAID